MDQDTEEVIKILDEYGEYKVKKYILGLKNTEVKNYVIDQIKNIDFKFKKEVFEQLQLKKEYEFNEEDVIEPLGCIDKEKIGKEDRQRYIKLGEKEIKEGKLAVVTMAGGQGTRLGFNGPKGAYDFGLDSHKTLFEVLADQIIEADAKYGVKIPWCIMTSNENDKQTKEFFASKDNLGFTLDEDLFFFEQGRLPMLTEDGNLIINEDGIIKLASNGHGGVYEALVKEKIIDRLKEKGVEYIYIGGVDNCLSKLVDSFFVGVAKEKNISVAAKSVIKSYPHEKVGVFCKRNGKPSVIEYSEISKEMAEKTNKNGQLVFGESNILCNLFTLDTVERMGSVMLPYHLAHKKTKYMNEYGEVLTPNVENAYKFESFLFDGFSSLDEIVVVRVNRSEEFAPIKNSDSAGVDCPSTARALYLEYVKKNSK